MTGNWIAVACAAHVRRGQEEGFLVGEVRVGDGAADPGVAGDVGDRGGPEPVTAEPLDGRGQDGLAGLGALARGALRRGRTG